jgi:hypothetical protein
MRFLNDEGIKFFQFGIPGNKVRTGWLRWHRVQL